MITALYECIIIPPCRVWSMNSAYMVGMVAGVENLKKCNK